VRGADVRKVGVRAGGCAELAQSVTRGSRASPHTTPRATVANGRTPRTEVFQTAASVALAFRREFSDFNAHRRPRGTTRWVYDNATWTRLAKLGQNWPRMDTAGQIWTTVAKSGQPMDKIFPSLVGARNTSRSVKPKFFPRFCRVFALLGLAREMSSLADRGVTRSKKVPGKCRLSRNTLKRTTSTLRTGCCPSMKRNSNRPT
jgi:hypothetical protein